MMMMMIDYAKLVRKRIQISGGDNALGEVDMETLRASARAAEHAKHQHSVFKAQNGIVEGRSNAPTAAAVVPVQKKKKMSQEEHESMFQVVLPPPTPTSATTSGAGAGMEGVLN